MDRRRALLTIVGLGSAFAAAGTLGGCGSGSDRQTTDAGRTPAVLRFRAPLVGGGGELDGSTLAGRPAAFWFWAPS